MGHIDIFLQGCGHCIVAPKGFVDQVLGMHSHDYGGIRGIDSGDLFIVASIWSTLGESGLVDLRKRKRTNGSSQCDR